ncbi:MAG: hypothetical protein H0X24_01840 [Ktedonobacterales bacterium]|nr:hypothetical protein [Ktedonobacterales bacterium]
MMNAHSSSEDALRLRIADAEALLRPIPEYDWLVRSGKQFWKGSEVAEVFGIDSRKVAEWCADGLIVGATEFGEKLGWRIPRSGLLVFFAERVKQGTFPAE